MIVQGYNKNKHAQISQYLVMIALGNTEHKHN